jgi:uncharacterized protein
VTTKIKLTRTADGKELRSFGSTMELRAADSDFSISGMAVAYNVRSAPIGGQFIEMVAPGAFIDTLRADDQVCCFNHEASQILGRKKAGTLALEDSPVGLKFRCQLDRSNPTHLSVYAAIKRGDVDGCSFQFSVPDGGDQWQQNGDMPLRTLRRAKLFELGPVVFPAYPQGTSVNARDEMRSLTYVLDLGQQAPNWRARHMAALAKLAPVIAQDKADLATIRREAERQAALEEVRDALAEFGVKL